MAFRIFGRFIMPVICVLCILVGTQAASHATECQPQFEDYPAEKITLKPPHKIKLSSQRTHKFRTQLRQALKIRPNFSGHYVLLTWGCGSPCHEIALVSATNGSVYFAPFLGRLGEDFRLSSRLLVLNPKPNNLFNRACHVWTNKSFKEVECCSNKRPN